MAYKMNRDNYFIPLAMALRANRLEVIYDEGVNEDQWLDIVKRIAAICEHANPRFDRDKFYEMCSIDPKFVSKH